MSSDFATDVAGFVGEIVMTAVGYNVSGDSAHLGNSRAFLRALSKNFLPILPSDAGKLVSCLLDNFVSYVPSSPHALSSPQSSPINEIFSPRNDANNASSSSSNSVVNGGSVAWKSSVDQLVTSIGSVGLSDGGGGGGSAAASYRRMVASFEEEPVESLEKQEIAFNLIAHVLEKVYVDPKLLEQVRIIAKEQLQSMPAFLKVSFIGVQFSVRCLEHLRPLATLLLKFE